MYVHNLYFYLFFVKKTLSLIIFSLKILNLNFPDKTFYFCKLSIQPISFSYFTIIEFIEELSFSLLKVSLLGIDIILFTIHTKV